MRAVEKVNPDHPLVKHYPGGQDHDQDKHGRRSNPQVATVPALGGRLAIATEADLDNVPPPEHNDPFAGARTTDPGTLILQNGIEITSGGIMIPVRRWGGSELEEFGGPAGPPSELHRSLIAQLEQTAPGLLDAAALRDVQRPDMKIRFVDEPFDDPLDPNTVGLHDPDTNELWITTVRRERHTQWTEPRDPDEIVGTMIHEIAHKVDDRHGTGVMDSVEAELGVDQFEYNNISDVRQSSPTMYDAFRSLAEIFGGKVTEDFSYPLVIAPVEKFPGELFAEGVRYYYTDREALRAFDQAFGANLEQFVETALGSTGALTPTYQPPLFKAEDHTPEEFFALLDWYHLVTGIQLPGEGMSPSEAYGIADQLWGQVEGDGEDFELEKHAQHDQKDHGNWADGQFTPPDRSEGLIGPERLPENQVEKFSQLRDKLLTHGGERVVVPLGGEEDLEKIVERGELMLPDDFNYELVEGAPINCHSNSCAIREQIADSWIVTGYALSRDGLWRQHTWVVAADDTLIETTTPREAYFGVFLEGEEEAEFIAFNKHYGPGDHPSGSSQDIHAGGFRRVWHLTQDPKFQLNPKHIPEQNYLSIFYPEESPGLYVTDTPEYWVNAHNYVTPFIAEIEVPRQTDQPEDFTPPGPSRQDFIPAADFARSRVVRVIPLDEWVREEYREPGWVEDWFSDEQIKVPEGYKYEGSAQDLTDEQISELRRRTERYLREVRGVSKRSILKHYGPGDHPSGSPQAAHGRTGPSGPVETEEAPTATQQGFGDRPRTSAPEQEPDLSKLEALRTLLADTTPAQLRVTKEQFATGNLYQEVFRGKAYMTPVGPQSYDPNTYLYVKNPTDDTVGFCGICGQGVIQKTGPEFRAELADDTETYRLRADAYKDGWSGMSMGNIGGREYDRWVSRAEESAAALARFDERGYAWAHFQPGRQNEEGRPSSDAANTLSWTAGERLGDKLIGTEEHGGKFHPYNPVSGHEKYITDEIVTAPVLAELEERRDVHVAYDQASQEALNRKERLRIEGDRLGREAMVEVKKVGRKVANEIDRRAAGSEPSYKVGDKVHVPDFSESQVEITAGPDENGKYDILTSAGNKYTVAPEEFVTDDSETKQLFEEKARLSKVVAAANEKVSKVYARHRPLYQETGSRNKYYAIPDTEIKRWGKRKGYQPYLALNESWADYGELTEVEVPLVTKVSEYTNRDFTHVDTDSPEFIAVQDEWKSKGFTLVSHPQYLDSMANEVNGTWGSGSERNRAQNKIKKIRQQIDGLQFTAKGGDFTQTVVEVLSEHREMGGEYTFVSKSAGAQMVTDVQDWLPTDWVEASNRLGELSVVKSNARGEYSSANQRVRTDDHETVLHELGHRTEHAFAEVRLLERAYYDSRTNNASDAQVKLSTLFPGYNYRSGEVTRPDEFTHAYMGKTYNGRGSVEEAYELLSMGLERIYFEESTSKRGGDVPTQHKTGRSLPGFKDHPRAMSPDFREFILGLLAVAGGK